MPKNNPVNKTKTSHYADMGIGNSCCSLPPEVPENTTDTQRCLADIAELEAARCCQRDSWLALKKAAELSQTMLPIVLQANADLRCQQMGINPTCIGSECPVNSSSSIL